MDMEKSIKQCVREKQEKGFIETAAKKICDAIINSFENCIGRVMDKFGEKEYRAQAICEEITDCAAEQMSISEDNALKYLRERMTAAELEDDKMPAWQIAAITVGSAAILAGITAGAAVYGKKYKAKRNAVCTARPETRLRAVRIAGQAQM